MKLDPDSPVMRFFGRLFDLALLQIIFVVSCIPVFTVGAALTAMFSVCRKLQQDSVVSVVRTYFADFKANFRQSTVAWLILAAAAVLLAVDIRYYQQRSESFLTVPLLIAYVVLAAVYVEFLYVFPIMAWFENKLLTHFKNAPMLALYHILPTVLISLVYWLVASNFVRVLPIAMFLGISGSAYIATWLFGIVFRKHGALPYEPQE